ncbi:hypothetical protein N7489_001181 [Penicillium chrysogenum]|uniref:Uncharacterized protein n=1 Tax=Penicillium chrysogenum TaxID=5076 RepID=A0ABQ8WIT2_PENCH|nr:uncharacterized protein N7489_001181 [Penicillium chrysogenum]KAJ5250771.1 hypothetical protein N7489_001181 [Penicillium chrysogenum]KAJ5266380.1 hypothetical protein N7524_007398 [Penicillium chrysogenum]KAJ5269669.1 hypothetical protein N7505_005427 [Penicillium chrysogenum]KAJ6147600.1 hypothetical protein N7497_009582 [Penicillium chrysogenum]
MSGVKFIMGNYRDKDLLANLNQRAEAIQRFVEQEEDESNRVMYISAIKDLLEIICEVYRKVSAGKTGLHLMHLLIGWLYQQPEEFVSIMEQQEPHALIIAASWGVLLKYTESSWLPADV